MLAGLRKGLLRYLLELIFTAISIGAAYYYYQYQGQQIIISSYVFILTLVTLKILAWALRKIWRKIRRNKDEQPKPTMTTVLGGAFLGTAWGTLMAAIFILTLEIIPLDAFFENNKYKKTLQASQARKILLQHLPKNNPFLQNVSNMNKVGANEEAKARLSQQEQYQELMQHPVLQTALQDPETARQLKEKDILGLVKNPKIKALLNNGEFLKKLLNLNFKKALGK